MSVYAQSALLLAVVLFGLWLLSLRLRDASIVDPFWGTGFVLVAGLAFARGEGAWPRAPLLLALVSVWGLRLSWHLARRNLGQVEDFRYAAMRRHHGARFWWVSLLTVFTFQGVLLWVISLPLQAALTTPQPAGLTAFDLLGVLLWLCGFVFEALGDHQLRRFRADPARRGQVLDTGLWRYTRHPNYFGDALLWWGHCCFALAVGAWATLVSPAIMTFLLRRVSGVTLLEQALVERKLGYREYIERTSPFLPWPPKRAHS